MTHEKDSSEKATKLTYGIWEVGELELSDELLRMEPEVRRRLEQQCAALITAQIEAMLFSAPGSGFVCFPYERADQPFVFYRMKS